MEPAQTPLRTEASITRRSEVTSLAEPRELRYPRPSGSTPRRGRLSPLRKDLGDRGTAPGAVCEREEKGWLARPRGRSPRTSAELTRPPALRRRHRAVTAVAPGPPRDLRLQDRRSVTRATRPKATAEHWFRVQVHLEGAQEGT